MRIIGDTTKHNVGIFGVTSVNRLGFDIQPV